MSAINFIRDRQWLYPQSDDDMKAIISLNLRQTRFDVDFLPTIQLIAGKKKMQVHVVGDFVPTVLDPMLERLEAFWTSKEKQKIKFERNRIKLIAPAGVASVRRLRNIENKLLAFFERWGYETDFTPSESKTRSSLTIDYSIGREKCPVITIDDLEHEPDFDPAILDFGDVRVVINKHLNGHYGYVVEEYVGCEWRPLKQKSKINKCDLKTSHFISTVLEMFNS